MTRSPSPLAPTLSRYADFFELFDDFHGYVRFFLLDDLVTDDCSVKFFMPFDNFRPPSVAKDVDMYNEYRPGTATCSVARPVILTPATGCFAEPGP